MSEPIYVKSYLCVVTPNGYRRLKEGELIRPTDLYPTKGRVWMPMFSESLGHVIYPGTKKRAVGSKVRKGDVVVRKRKPQPKRGMIRFAGRVRRTPTAAEKKEILDQVFTETV